MVSIKIIINTLFLIIKTILDKKKSFFLPKSQLHQVCKLIHASRTAATKHDL